MHHSCDRLSKAPSLTRDSAFRCAHRARSHPSQGKHHKHSVDFGSSARQTGDMRAQLQWATRACWLRAGWLMIILPPANSPTSYLHTSANT